MVVMAAAADKSGVKIEVVDKKPAAKRRYGESDEDDLDDVFEDPTEDIDVKIKESDTEISLQPVQFKSRVQVNNNSLDAGNKVQKPKAYKESIEEDTEVHIGDIKQNKDLRYREKDRKDVEEYTLKPMFDKHKTKKGDKKANEHESPKKDKLGTTEESDQLTLKPIGNAKVIKSDNKKGSPEHVSKITVEQEKDKHSSSSKLKLSKPEQGILQKPGRKYTGQLDHIESRPIKIMNSEVLGTQNSDPQNGNNGITDVNGKRTSPERLKMISEQQELAKQKRQKDRAGKRSVSFNQEANTDVSSVGEGDQMTMSKKFRRLARQMSEQSSVTSSFRRKHRKKRPNTCFDLALFACCCCCSPLGGLGMIFSVMSDNAHKDRNYDKAQKLRRATIGVSVFGILLTIIIVIILLVTQAVPKIQGS